MRILTVDDSAVARRQIRNELEPAGYTVHEATSGEAALAYVVEHAVDLVTLDVHMPGMDGWETCQHIRAMELLTDEATDAGLPVIFVTADDTLAGREAGFEAGAADFIVKPFAPGSVRRAVDGLLRPPPADHGLTVLVAEDSPLVRRITCEALAQMGLVRVTAGDGREAWDRLRADPEAVHLVVTDYIMPHMNGDQLCRRIRRHAPTADMPVMVLSALDSPETVQALLGAGATDFVPKPWVKEAFQARVAELVPGRAMRQALRRRLARLHGETRYREALQHFARPGADNAFAAALGRVDALRDGSGAVTEAVMRDLPTAGLGGGPPVR